jgi:hypothetical protein
MQAARRARVVRVVASGSRNEACLLLGSMTDGHAKSSAERWLKFLLQLCGLLEVMAINVSGGGR